MKILYAIQGTGNGHLSRAKEILPVLYKNHDVDILISGTHAELKLPYPVKYKFSGLGFIFGSKGGVDLYETYKKNYIKVLLSEIGSLPVNDYDLVLNDFEPVSAWACYFQNKECISISHQSAVLNKKAPKPKDIDVIGKSVLKNYAPVSYKYGFHFKAYDENIFTPVIRAEVRQQKISNKGHYTVYLPAYDDERILKVLKLCGDVKWEVFSKHNKAEITRDNITIRAIDNEAFIESMASAKGVICGAGFEAPAEALFMGKQLLVVPMKGQYEQQCNAAALKDMGVQVMKSFKVSHVEKIQKWIENEIIIRVNYPDKTEKIINGIITRHSIQRVTTNQAPEQDFSVEKFRKLLLKKIVAQF